MRGRTAEVETDKAIVVNLVDQNFGGLGRAALGDRVNDAEGFKSGCSPARNAAIAAAMVSV